MKERVVTRYSEAFKLEVVDQITSGRFASITQAASACGITGSKTILKWLKKYGGEEVLPKYVKVMTRKALDETAELKKRVRDLERALADAHMLHLLEKAHLKIACEHLGTDRESFKKKHATTLLEVPAPRGKP